MLRLMRKHAGNWLIKILLGAIVIVFIFWGVGSFRSQRGSRVATVNGDQITLDEYRDTYNNLMEQLRARFGNKLDEKMIKTLQVKRQALDRLINNRLLVQEAKKLKFRVSEKELANAILHIPAFQRSGVFDKYLYKSVLDRLRMTPESFEAAQKNQMLIDKLRTLVTSNAKVSHQEVRDWYDWLNTSVDIEYAFFDPNQYNNVLISEEQIKSFYEKHKEKYKTDTMIKVRYVHFDPKQYQSKVKLSDSEVREYYDENLESFKIPKKVVARHILIKVNPDADPETVKEAKEKALKILKMAREGKDFAELAKKYSEGPSRNNGGYLGEFTKESMVKPFADKAFSMKAGEISEPVRTRFGWHIIKVEKVIDAHTTPFKDAEKEIRKKLTDNKAKSLAYDAAESVSDIAYQGDDLINAAKERHLKILTTDFFSKENPAKGIPDPSKFANTAFDLSTGEISDVREFNDGYYILQLLDKVPPKIPPLDKVRQTVKADLIKEIQDEKAKADASSFLAALKSGKPLSEESKKFHLMPKTTGFFKRNGSIPDIGYDRGISEAAFQLSRDKKLPENVLKGAKGYYVIQYKGRKITPSEPFDKEKGTIREQLLAQKKSEIFDALLAQLKSKADITIKEGFLE
ncbi:MAG: SurA N-terminal domain-containing protein [Desulfobacterales bacterium]|nr:SurA N-terminal domain-containing protein [Desulfobacterales bacterium]